MYSCDSLNFFSIDYSELLLRQFTDLHFFTVGPWCFISFLWGSHVSLIIHDPFSFTLVSCAFEKVGTSSSLYRLVSADEPYTRDQSMVVKLVIDPDESLGSWVPIWNLGSQGLTGSLGPQEPPRAVGASTGMCQKPAFTGVHQELWVTRAA